MKREKVLACMLAVLLLPLIIANVYLEAQEQEWLWASSAGGSNIEVTDMAVDSEGNSYFTGHFSGRVNLGHISLSTNSRQDIFVAKIDAQGVWQWANRAHSRIEQWSDYSKAIAVDNDGNCYITGAFYSSARFGDIEVQNSQLAYAIFVAKLNTDGDWLWVRVGEGLDPMSFYMGTGIAVDNTGGCYIVGYAGNARFGQYQLPADWMRHNGFVAKISSTGNWQWAVAVSVELSFNVRFTGITASYAGNVFLTGTFDDTVRFGATALHSMGRTDSFVAAISRHGNWLWARQIGGDFDVNTEDVSSDLIGNAYVIGYYHGEIFFGNHSKQAGRFGAMFVAKIDSDGVWQWIREAEEASCIAISTDSNGNSYITGLTVRYPDQIYFGDIEYSSDYVWNVFVARLNANGTWQWVRAAVSEEEFRSKSIVADEFGNCYITGGFRGLCFFDNLELTPRDDSAIFAAKLLVTTTGISEDSEPAEAPRQTFLGYNYPNPFNPETEIEFYLIADTDVLMTVYNNRGQIVRTLKKGMIRAGEHRVLWNGKDDNGRELSSGIYFYKLKTPEHESVRKMLLIK